MGVPGFWGGWLRRFFVDHRRFKESSDVINTFSIDMNGVLHTCLNKINSDSSIEGDIEEAFIQEIHRELTRICNKFCRDGCQALIVCVDGVAPVAKMMQQRSRRFKASMLPSEGKIDRNSLSPGTRIMDRIDEGIVTWATSTDAPPGLEFIKSSHRVPGEGEHKIFQVLKARSLQKPHQANLIYGLDADFTMISLVSEVRNIWLVREEQPVSEQDGGSAASAAGRPVPQPSTTLLSIETLKTALKDTFMGSKSVKTPLRQLCDDFVLVMSLLGNDFVPRVPDVGDVGGWINKLLTTYRELGIPLTERVVRDSGSFPIPNLENFKIFLTEFSKKEAPNLAEIAVARFRFPFKMVIECSEATTTTRGDSEISVNVPLLKERWYARAAASVGIIEENILPNVRDDMCLNFVKMISWILLYYGTQCDMSRTTFYPFHFAPFVSDLANLSVFKASTLCERSIFKDHPWLVPIEQAVLTQPRASSAIILDFPGLEEGAEVALLLDKAEDVVGETIIEAKTADHQGVTVVEFPDFGKLSKIVNPPLNDVQALMLADQVPPKGAERGCGKTSWSDDIPL